MRELIQNENSIGDKIVASVQKAIDKMLVQKAKDGLDVVIAGPDGEPMHVKASELIKKK